MAYKNVNYCKGIARPLVQSIWVAS